jgi:methyl-accepting chemotaxis protein
MDGVILNANPNFLAAMGYELDEVRGQHHSMFMERREAEAKPHKDFWAALRRGQFQAGEFERMTKDGREIWIQASYNPILDDNGHPVMVMKAATDVTAQKMRNADLGGQIDAINKSQAVIHFNMDGTIIQANENFLATVGYDLSEVQGRHHSMFVDPEEAKSWDYASFWQKLGQGVFQTREFRRFGKGGKEIWLQASYNPIFDLSGRPFKVVKYASDVTAEKLRSADFKGQIQAINNSQAVIHFAMDGTILDAMATAWRRCKASTTKCSSPARWRRPRSTRSSGRSCGAASSCRRSTRASTTTAARCSSRRPTTQSGT